MGQDIEGLDYAFLKYIGVSPQNEADLHKFYLRFLEDQHRVLDLGCGFGGFVNLMRTSGKDAVGVDSDPMCITEAIRHQAPVVEADVVEYLRSTEQSSWDAIVAAHLVEHMPYDVVIETIRLAYRALVPGGKLLVVTPNPRALVSHMELYPMHFGHVAMYHPTLLAFFMEFAGFSHAEIGENPLTPAAAVAGGSPIAELQDIVRSALHLGSRLEPNQVIPKPANPFQRIAWTARTRLIRWLLQPYFDQISGQLHQTGTLISSAIDTLDRSFECYVIGYKD